MCLIVYFASKDTSNVTWFEMSLFSVLVSRLVKSINISMKNRCIGKTSVDNVVRLIWPRSDNLTLRPNITKLVRFWPKKAQKVRYLSPSQTLTTQPVQFFAFTKCICKKFALCTIYFNLFRRVMWPFGSFSLCCV